MHSIKSSVGVFILNDEGRLREFREFSSDDDAVKELLIEPGDSGVSNKGLRLFIANQETILKAAGVDPGLYAETRKRVAFLLANEKKRATLSVDRTIIHHVDILKDLHKALNLLISRAATIYSDYGVNIEIGEDRADFKAFLSAEHPTNREIELFRDKILDLIAYRDKMEKELTELMNDNAPNLSGLIGPLLGAKLIMLANGLERLARMPGSRIQVLGAGRAMFRHLRQKGKAPKHGILFEHPLVGKSPWWQRGKIARSLSAKISIAARLDAYSDADRSAELKSDFMRRYDKIKKDFQSKPKALRIIRRPGKKNDRFRRG